MITGWIHEATTDLARIAEWVEDSYFAGCNIGIECTGWVVIDVDPRNGGHEALELWRRAAPAELALPRTRVHITGSLGWHMIYRAPAGIEVRNGPWLRGVEIKTAGGLVVAPGSLHLSGRFYTVEDPQVPIADLPAEFAERELRRAAEARRRDTERVDPVALLDGVPEGLRNQTLFDAAWQMRWEHGVDQAGCLAVILAAARACSPPYEDSAARDVVERVYGYEDRGGLPGNNVLLLPGAIEWARNLGRVQPAENDDQPAGLLYPLTDMGNAVRMRDVARDLKYAPGWGWVHWRNRWLRDGADLDAVHTAKDAIVRMAVEEGSVDDLPRRERQELDRWIKTSQSSARVNAMISLAQELLRADVEDFDSNDWELNTPSGIVDLRSGKVTPHGDFETPPLVTKITGVPWDPQAQCPQWLEFLERVLPDEQTRGLVQRAAGYSLTGDTSAKAMLVLWGSGNNGKSVFIETLRNVLGSYSLAAMKSVFIQRPGGGDHSTDLASLAGARFVTFAEVARGDKLAVDTVKQITGGDKMSARYMRQDPFEFTPRAKLWLATNYRPGLVDFGPAMKDRLRLVPFTVEIPPEERRDRTAFIAELSWLEGAGILQWAWLGLQAYLGDGWLGDTLETGSAKEEWVNDEDSVGQFIEASVVKAERWFTDNATVSRYYRKWCSEVGIDHPMSGIALSRELVSRGFVPCRSRGKRGFQLALRADVRVDGLLPVVEWELEP